jgi:hypothetical protein
MTSKRMTMNRVMTKRRSDEQKEHVRDRGRSAAYRSVRFSGSAVWGENRLRSGVCVRPQSVLPISSQPTVLKCSRSDALFERKAGSIYGWNGTLGQPRR